MPGIKWPIQTYPFPCCPSNTIDCTCYAKSFKPPFQEICHYMCPGWFKPVHLPHHKGQLRTGGQGHLQVTQIDACIFLLPFIFKILKECIIPLDRSLHDRKWLPLSPGWWPSSSSDRRSPAEGRRLLEESAPGRRLRQPIGKIKKEGKIFTSFLIK